MGPTNHLAAVKMALQTNGIEYQVRQPVMLSQKENSRGGSDLIAIVGMAGKFPGSDTVDGFWEDLMAGKCHIKEVCLTQQEIDNPDAYNSHTIGPKKPVRPRQLL